MCRASKMEPKLEREAWVPMGAYATGRQSANSGSDIPRKVEGLKFAVPLKSSQHSSEKRGSLWAPMPQVGKVPKVDRTSHEKSRASNAPCLSISSQQKKARSVDR